MPFPTGKTPSALHLSRHWREAGSEGAVVVVVAGLRAGVGVGVGVGLVGVGLRVVVAVLIVGM